MTAREKTTIDALAYFCAHSRKWARPLDVGGRSGTHHGATLLRLAKKKLIDVQVYRVCARRTYKYRVFEATTPS